MKAIVNTFSSGSGDCIFLRLEDHDTLVYSMMVDCGKLTPEIENFVATTLNKKIDLLMVSHYDDDHVKGVCCLLHKYTDLEIGKILYNCHQYEVAQHKITKGNTDLLDAQANNLTPLIDENYHKIGSVTASLLCCLIHANEKWNNAWYKKMLKRGDVISLDDGKMGQLYILSPTEEVLSSLWNRFKTEYASITHEKMPEGTWTDQDKYYEMLSRLCKKKKRPAQAVPIGARTIKDKESLICAAKNNERETLTLPNQSSLAAIWELNGKRIFLTGDADPDILLDGLNTYSQGIVPFEVVKLPHHGSRNNLTTSLMDKMNASHYMLTGGKSHEGPHWEALAKVITHTNVNGAHTLHVSGSAGEELLRPVWEGALNDVLKEYQCFVNKHNEVSFEC